MSYSWAGNFFYAGNMMISFWESANVPGVKTAQFLRRNPERVGSVHPSPVPQPLSWTPLIIHSQSVEERWARTYHCPCGWCHPWGAGHQVPRRRRTAAERQSRLIFVAFRRAPEDAGAGLGFRYPGWGVGSCDEEGKWARGGVGSVLFVA